MFVSKPIMPRFLPQPFRRANFGSPHFYNSSSSLALSSSGLSSILSVLNYEVFKADKEVSSTRFLFYSSFFVSSYYFLFCFKVARMPFDNLGFDFLTSEEELDWFDYVQEALSLLILISSTYRSTIFRSVYYLFE